MKLLVEVSTKDRDSTLGRCMAALLQQSWRDSDILIINDGDEPVGNTQTTAFMIEELRRHHEVYIIPGSHISQAHNHNFALYDPRFTKYEYIIRLDDDVLLNADAILYMAETIAETQAGAVGGLWFEAEWLSDDLFDRRVAHDLLTSPSTHGKVGPFNSNWQQRQYHPTAELYEVEHLYSSCIYNAEKMRRAGGWPEVYSRGVAHGEETDGTYRLFLSGEKLFVDPRVIGIHLRAPGGIRSAMSLSETQSLDLVKWQRRLPQFRDINWEPAVAVECRHMYGLGGAERQFYHTVSLLQSKTGLTVHPMFHGGLHLSPKECEGAFGFSYDDPGERRDEYDILIVMGHEPTHKTRARHKILYTFFPIETPRETLLEFDAIIGNSDYTAYAVRELWRFESSHIYPPVEPIGRGDVEKENVILAVARCVPHKAPLWLMERFVEFNFPGWQLHIVAGTTTESFRKYEDQVWAFAQQRDNVYVHRNIPDNALKDLYRRAKILWSAVGMMSKAPQHAEHFGYTPVEAWSAGCVPIVYDRGGHRETVPSEFRWSTAEELEDITRRSMRMWHDSVSEQAVIDVARFNSSDYVRQWENLIRRINAMALELVPVEEISISPERIRVACISDSPRLTTGFGVVAKEIYSYLAEQPDIDLFVYGMMDSIKQLPDEEMPWHFYETPLGSDLQARGNKTLPAFIKWCKPDVIFEIYDPGNMHGHVMTMRGLGIKQPIVAYFPVEGKPISHATYNLVQKVTFPVTYCDSGRRAIEALAPDIAIDVIHHGIDHAPFGPLPDDKRNELRSLVGWDGKFIVMNLGTNKRVKQQPYLIDAMRLLMEQGHEDIYLYLHTQKFDNHVMQGWTLGWLRSLALHDLTLDAEHFKELQRHILFPAEFDKWHGPVYKYASDPELWKLTTPPEAKFRGAILNGLDLVTRYALSDLYVDVSSAEGWGLPVLEAVACGVPAVSVNDGHVRSEIHSAYCYDMLEPKHWTTWHTSSKLMLVDPEEIAEKILEAKNNYAQAKDLTLDASRRIMSNLKWQDAGEAFADLIRKAAIHGAKTTT